MPPEDSFRSVLASRVHFKPHNITLPPNTTAIDVLNAQHFVNRAFQWTSFVVLELIHYCGRVWQCLQPQCHRVMHPFSAAASRCLDLTFLHH